MRTLASMVILVGCIGAANGLPPPRVAEAQAGQDEIDIALESGRQAVLAKIVAHFLGLRPEPTHEQIERRISDERQKLESELARQIAEIDRTCNLTDAEKTKLQLTGRAEISGFLDPYERALRKFQGFERENKDLDKMLDEANHFQITLAGGLFHEDSLLVKSLPNTLTSEQFAQYEVMARKRREERLRESVREAVVRLQRVFQVTVDSRKKHGKLKHDIVVREAQWQDLITLMNRETRPSRRPSGYDSHVLLSQLSHLPEEKLKRLFDQDQWEIIHSAFPVFQSHEPMLKREGLLPAEGDGANSIHQNRGR
jgi:hypothetical protein